MVSMETFNFARNISFYTIEYKRTSYSHTLIENRETIHNLLVTRIGKIGKIREEIYIIISHNACLC